MASNLAPPSNTLPFLAALIGSGGFINGIHNFQSTTAAATLYGVPIPSKATTSESLKTLALSRWKISYILATGTRNFATGLSIMALSAYWRFSSDCQISNVSQAVKKCLGIVILGGSVVPVADAVITYWASLESGITEHERKVGVRASVAHGLRSLVWTAVGAACLK